MTRLAVAVMLLAGAAWAQAPNVLPKWLKSERLGHLEVRWVDFGWTPEGFAAMETGAAHPDAGREWMLAMLRFEDPLRFEGRTDLPPLYGFQVPTKSIGKVKSFWGQFGMMVRAYTYMRVHGAEGLRKISEHAVLNANYLMARMRTTYRLPYDRVCMHEFVLEGVWDDAPGIHALDIAKRMMDYGLHPPTNYFPLIVHEALMIEPTETESKQSLDYFVETMEKIAAEARTDPELLLSAPHKTSVGRLDEVKAAKELVLCCGVGSES